MEVLEFRKINLSDEFDNRYNDGFAWSRVYEYPLVLKLIDKFKDSDKTLSIHNTSWGFSGVHVTFKDYFDSLYPNTIHSDIKKSNLEKTFVYNITEPPTNDLLDRFDVVLNISTVEEVNYDQMKIFDNLYSQVKDGGILILTFDLPGLDLKLFESKFNINIKVSENDINGSNSKLKNMVWSNLNCGVMVIKK